MLFVYNGTDGATVYGPYFAGDKYLQDEYELGYVKFRKEGDAKLALTDIVLNENLAYSGRVHWDGSDVLRLLSFWESSQPTTREDEIANLHKKVADLEARSPEKVVEERVVERVVEKAVPERVEELPSRIVHSGFSGGRALFGNWQTTQSVAKQVDTKQLYAKYSVPVSQNQNETLFSFNAKMSGQGWIGFGLHFFVSGDKQVDAYGLGKSLLVWLTKDPVYYGNDRTYIQAYRSYDDISMAQIASVRIPESILSSVKVDVLYNRSANVIAAFVNGEKKLEIKEIDSAIWSGNKVAFRSLGGEVEFSSFTVKTR